MSHSADDYFDAANICELDSRWSEANDNYTRALELKPDFVEAYDNRAGNWVELGELARAIADYHKVMEYWPDYAEAHNNLASIYLDTDDQQYLNPKLALSHAKEACKLTGDNRYDFLATYARAFHACKYYDKAVYYQQLAVKLASQVIASGGDRIDQINAEVALSGLEDNLERLRADATAAGANNTSLVGRVLSLLKPLHRKTDRTNR